MTIKKELDCNVIDAAKNRIIAMFRNKDKIQLSFSGGKDSIVLSDIMYNLCAQGKIDKSKLKVMFVDEEAMYDDVIEIVKKWRLKWLEIGVTFEWYCVQVKHYNCLNSMSEEETFICWDERKRDVWVRDMPKWAIKDDKYLIPHKDNYQSWAERRDKCTNTISTIGLRAAESIQRRSNIAKMSYDELSCKYPIYDMTDKDIWLYILKYNIEIPDAYERLYRVGTPKNKLRISQFFSIDTAKSLVSLSELYPNLMERVTKREPNAYLCALYWDTEMFGKRTKTRRATEDEEKKDYRKMVMEKIANISAEPSAIKRKTIREAKRIVTNNSVMLDDKIYKQLYDMIVAGDPKSRTKRVILHNITENGKKNEGLWK